MKFFCLRIRTAKSEKRRLDAERARRIKDNALIAKLMAEKAFLQKSTEKLVGIVKSRQQIRAAARRLEKQGIG